MSEQLDLFGEAAVAAAGECGERKLEVVEEAPPQDKAAQYEAVRQPALGCVRCDLAQSRTQVVFGEGDINSPMVLVGEGPGETEDATGRPFVGRAGQLLDKALAENGIKREQVYICNVVKCRPTSVEDGKVKNRAPTPDEIEACNVWLDAQLRLIQPLVIVCIGGPSANTLIHKDFKITKERGKFFDTSPYAPYIMATLHPAYVLRQHGPAYEHSRGLMVQDIGAARQKVIEARRASRERT
jgi:uracil-DNA glycosylase